MSKFIVKPSHSLRASIKVPGDKSISHRSIILGSIANGVTTVEGFLQGEDTLLTLEAFRSMGVKIERSGANLKIHGVGINGLSAPKKPIYLGNSGTSMRLMTGLLAAQKFNSELYGDESLTKRPMNRVIEPLMQMGAVISSNDGKSPLKIIGGQTLKAIKYHLPVASAQIKSSLLLAGLYAKGETTIIEPAPTRDHTERMLQGFGYKTKFANGVISLFGGSELTSCALQVPSDISSAAFFMVAASIADDADITLLGVNINPTRTGIIDILQLMGADITLTNKIILGGELLADIRIRSAKLTAITVPESLVPLAIDEIPVALIAASCATGITTITGAKELRVKESDRIQAMADGLEVLGVKTEVLEDGIKVIGSEFKKPIGVVNSHHDHRISMSFAMAANKAKYPITIAGVDNVKTSFPNFVELANEIGMQIEQFE